MLALPARAGILTDRQIRRPIHGHPRRPQRQRVVLPGTREWFEPSIQAGLTFNAPWVNGTAPLLSAAGTTGLSTETVDADGTRTRETDGYIVQALANTARFTPDGVLSEVASENLCKQSEDLGTTWTAVNSATVATDQIVAPDGNTTADKVTDPGAGGSGGFGMSVGNALVANATYVFSAYCKAGDTPSFSLVVYDLGGGGGYRARIDFAWTAGVASVKAEDVGTGYVKDVGDGWYRCEARIPANQIRNGVNHTVYVQPTEEGVTPGSPAYMYFWGMQFEQQASATSYIPTTSAAVTRSKEDLDYAGGANFSWTSGTLSVSVTANGLHGANQYICDLYVDANDRISLYLDSTGKPTVDVVDGGSTVASLTSTSALTAGTTAVVTIVWTAGDVRLYVNGGDEKSDTPATMPSGSGTIFIGQSGANDSQLNGAMKHLLISDQIQSAAEVAYVYSVDYQRWN